MQFIKDYSTPTFPSFVSFSVNPIWDEGEVIGLSCYAKNVTDEKLVEEKIRQTEHLLSEAQQLGRIGNWNVDVVKNEIYWSEGTRMLYGVDGDFEASFPAYISMLHPDDKERVLHNINEAGKKGEAIEHQFRIIRKDGAVRIIKSQTRFMLDVKGNIVRIYGLEQDVTESVQAEETLKRSEANLNTIFNNGDTIYVLVDSALKIVSFNQLAIAYAAEQLEKPLEEGRDIMDCVAPDKQLIVYETMQHALAGNEVAYESHYPLPGSDFKYYHTRYFPVSNEQGSTMGIIVAINDITDRKAEEAKTLNLLKLLQQKNKDLGQFTYIVSHNLRAPIAKILGLVDLFKNNTMDDLSNETLMEYVANEATNLDNVVKDLNTITSSRDLGSEAREMVNFDDELQLILQVLEKEINDSGAVITAHFKEKGIFVIKSYLYSIMYNLLSNAIKYRSPHRQLAIFIQSKREHDNVSLSVADNGLGMDLTRNSKKIFGLYKRFHGEEIPGKGIGLYLVKTQAEALGGSVDVKSEPNEGTTFKISIPL